jgi:hypothetical protein
MPFLNGNISKVRSSEETNIPLKFSLYAMFCATALETLPNYEIYMEF